jgi:hypothetical protein
VKIGDVHNFFAWNSCFVKLAGMMSKKFIFMMHAAHLNDSRSASFNLICTLSHSSAGKQARGIFMGGRAGQRTAANDVTRETGAPSAMSVCRRSGGHFIYMHPHFYDRRDPSHFRCTPAVFVCASGWLILCLYGEEEQWGGFAERRERCFIANPVGKIIRTTTTESGGVCV